MRNKPVLVLKQKRNLMKLLSMLSDPVVLLIKYSLCSMQSEKKMMAPLIDVVESRDAKTPEQNNCYLFYLYLLPYYSIKDK